MSQQPAPATVPGVQHHHLRLDGRVLHHVTAGDSGSPVLLVHGFPESWWTFSRLVPLLAADHRVVAVDLPGFGDSDPRAGDQGSVGAAEDLHRLVEHLGLGPVHLSGQDIAGDTVVRLAATHPEDVLSLTAVEMALAGHGLESFADVAHGGAWHVGALATPGVAEFVFPGREREFLERLWFPAMTTVPGAVTGADLDEFTRVWSRPGAWQGAAGLYAAGLSAREGEELRALLADRLQLPVLAVDALSAPFTARTMQAVAADVTTVVLDGVGHHPALEAPDRLADALLGFLRAVDARR